MLKLATILLATAAASLVVVGSASPESSSCGAGYALTAGGVTQADINLDGLTCELTTTLDGVPTLIAVDNGPGPAVVLTTMCPDAFVKAPATPLPGTPPDRNGNGVICVKVFFTFIDDVPDFLGVPLPVPSFCPDDFTLAPDISPFGSADRNRNGLICVRKTESSTDDILVPA